MRLCTLILATLMGGTSLGACQRRPAPAARQGATGRPSTPPVARERAAPLSREACFRAGLAVDALLLKAGQRCQRDDDCDCYNGGLVLRGCRWVARRDGLAPVKARTRALLARGCTPATTCAPFACRARCRDLGQGRRCVQRGGCAELTARYAALLKGADAGRCARDADCVLYPAGIAPNCGGATDGATGRALAPVEQDFRRQKCPYAIHCKARALGTPACLQGRCFERRGR